jgi:hypothetical protein
MLQLTVVFHLGHFERSPVGEFSYTPWPPLTRWSGR